LPSLPADIWKEISFYLPPFYLCEVNKNLNTIYDNYWGKEHLEYAYPRYNFSSDSNYYQSVKKSMKQGNIVAFFEPGGIHITYITQIIFKG
jgi:hypothetical protein